MKGKINIRKVSFINPLALRMAKTPLSFGRSECKRVKELCVAECLVLQTFDH